MGTIRAVVPAMFKQKLKSSIRQIAATGYYATNHYLNRLMGKVAILAYHRVVSDKELVRYYIQPGMYVKSDVFEMQIKFLREHFTILSFAELLDIWEQNKWDNTRRYCVITFDDGWLDNYLYAYPVLKKYNIPATIFLTTSYICTTQWFWPDKMSFLLQRYYTNGIQPNQKEAIKDFFKRYPWLIIDNEKIMSQALEIAIEKCKDFSHDEINNIIIGLSKLLNALPPDNRLLLDWREVKEMSNHNISFGSHSSNHMILTKLSTQEIQKELEESQHILTKMGINYVPVFCYPNGDYTDKIVEQVKTSGYQAAVSTKLGFEGTSPPNRYSLKRICIHNDISKTLPLFTYRLSFIG
jgi:peptidoglycan/xylan/chitin deacetylase (PgdA/CDA1 family)